MPLMLARIVVKAETQGEAELFIERTSLKTGGIDLSETATALASFLLCRPD